MRQMCGPVEGREVVIDGEEFYQIANYDRMRPFFLSLVSAGDQWLFLSSNGALTAGRGTPDWALFPYYTDDKIRDTAEVTGSKTLLRVSRRGSAQFWEPFSERYAGLYKLRRNLFKNFRGNKLIFEEINEDLQVVFRYGWFSSSRFGFVRRAWLENLGRAVRVELLDGLQNLMPTGVGSQFQLEYSTLLDAYKKSELVEATGLGLIRLSAIPVDRPEPAEALRTTAAWALGLGKGVRLLSSVQLEAFRHGEPLRTEADVRGERGAYFALARFSLGAGRKRSWVLGADVGLGPAAVADLNRRLRHPESLLKDLEADIEQGTEELTRIVAGADGLQLTACRIGDARHFGNVLANVMRGGTTFDAYQIQPGDLLDYVRQANPELAARHGKLFKALGGEPGGVHFGEALRQVCDTGDLQLERLCREYLPLTFSRRHGDPSRPWNRFSIATRNADGTRRLGYEGNWRDIFQNWEALAQSFPLFTAGMVCKFLNASTADGHNPYRIMRGGIDWEVPNPADPWAHIGYWGDHQVIYLLKLLETLQRHEPETLRGFLSRDLFAYADVPYRIKQYEALLANPKETIVFDRQLDARVRERARLRGADGRLVWADDRSVKQVSLTEKALVLMLARLANFIPEGGIWLNTQRPEWNDANNALVGNGVSMVTLYYLRRFLGFFLEVYRPLAASRFEISSEVRSWFRAVGAALEAHRPVLERGMDERARKDVLDALGRAGSRYRQALYARGFSGSRSVVRGRDLVAFIETVMAFVDASIAANRRPDGLYHAYNLVRLDQGKALPLRRLYEMLEGQVAVLSSGRLSPQESLRLLTALRRSSMYRPDQHSYLLYPNRQLSGYLEKNVIPPAAFKGSRLLRRLAARGDTRLIECDRDGRCHFSGAITNAGDVSRILDALAGDGLASLVKRERAAVLKVFEAVFDHESFTGRSGTFFGYEGLNSIYWHMVSKLLLAAQESFLRAAESDAPDEVVAGLAACYEDIREGIGDRKTAANYGAFPMDPYSHTPGHAGARQPGLTGQVKEDILCRLGELGVSVREGRIRFQPRLLNAGEFLKSRASFRYYDVAGKARAIRLEAGCLAFTYCQVPVVYQLCATSGIAVAFADGRVERIEGAELPSCCSRAIHGRFGQIQELTVFLRRDALGGE
jgi:hypothetical protein